MIAERFFAAVPGYLRGDLVLLREMAQSFEFFVALLNDVPESGAGEEVP